MHNATVHFCSDNTEESIVDILQGLSANGGDIYATKTVEPH